MKLMDLTDEILFKIENNLKLFICGSSASWIIKKIIYDKGGLHNRVTRQIILRPFLLHETEEYLCSKGCNYNYKQILEIYMAMGGTPYYLNGIKKSLSAAQNINNMCFRNGGLLIDELNKLFRSLFHDADVYIELTRIIAKRTYGIPRTELEKNIQLSHKGGTLTDRLQDLENAGFILSFIPLGYKERGKYYKIIDEYVLFYFNYIEPEITAFLKIERKTNIWQLNYNTPVWHNWAGYAFEAVCYKHIDLIRIALDIPNGSKAAVWRYVPSPGSVDQGAQIDLLFDRPDSAITLCEIKLTAQPFVITKDYANNLKNKMEVFKRKQESNKQIFIAMIVAAGLKNNMYAEELVGGVVTLNDLFKVLH